MLDLLPLFEKLGGLGKSLWQRRRFGPRLTISLGWDHDLIVLPGPNRRYRAVNLTITAPMKDEFVVAKGTVEARAGGERRWTRIGVLEELLSLPTVVEPNRQQEETVSGESLASLLEAASFSAGVVVLRFTVEDYHKGKVRSGKLRITIEELEREKVF